MINPFLSILTGRIEKIHFNYNYKQGEFNYNPKFENLFSKETYFLLTFSSERILH